MDLRLWPCSQGGKSSIKLHETGPLNAFKVMGKIFKSILKLTGSQEMPEWEQCDVIR